MSSKRARKHVIAWLCGAGIVAALGIGLGSRTADAEPAFAVPVPLVDQSSGKAGVSESVILAGGCFWGVQGVFQHLDGVTSAVSGYAGGDRADATYSAVSAGRTAHAEAVRITFDPRRISYGRILQVYFSVAHDPTQLNRQGPDSGRQYRSAIFPAGDEQARVARAYIDQLDAANVFRAKIATTIEPDRLFHPAEAYHQNFMTAHPNHPYIVINDLPKIEELRRLFPDQYRAAPALVADVRTGH